MGFQLHSTQSLSLKQGLSLSLATLHCCPFIYNQSTDESQQYRLTRTQPGRRGWINVGQTVNWVCDMAGRGAQDSKFCATLDVKLSQSKPTSQWSNTHIHMPCLIIQEAHNVPVGQQLISNSFWPDQFETSNAVMNRQAVRLPWGD